jgi:hypothetical protein
MSILSWGLVEFSHRPAALEAALSVLDASPLPPHLLTSASVDTATIHRWVGERNFRRAARGIRTVSDSAILDILARTLTRADLRAAVCRNPATTNLTAAWQLRHGGATVASAVRNRDDFRSWAGRVSDAELDVYIHEDDPAALAEFAAPPSRGRLSALAARTWLPMGEELEQQVLYHGLVERASGLDPYLLERLVQNPQVTVPTALAAMRALTSSFHLKPLLPAPAVLDAVVASGEETLWSMISRDPRLSAAHLRVLAGARNHLLLEEVLLHPSLPYDAQHALWGRGNLRSGTAQGHLLRNENVDPQLVLQTRSGRRVTKNVPTSSDEPWRNYELLPDLLAVTHKGKGLVAPWLVFSLAERLAENCLAGREPRELFDAAAAAGLGAQLFRFPFLHESYPATASLLGATRRLRVSWSTPRLLAYEADRLIEDDLAGWQVLCSLLPGWDGTISELIDCVRLV